MTTPYRPGDRSIKNLIRNEIDAAERILPKEVRLRRLHERMLKSDERKGKTLSPRVGFAALMAGLAVVVVGVFLLVRHPRERAAGSTDMREPLRRFLASTSGARSLERICARSGLAAEPVSTTSGAVAARLASAITVFRISRGADPQGFEHPARELGLRERVAALFGERVVHRFFMRFREKNKEEKDAKSNVRPSDSWDSRSRFSTGG